MDVRKLFLSVPTSLCVASALLFAGDANAVTISATAYDNGMAGIFNNVQSYQDGDFLLKANDGTSKTRLGDGWDETVTWDFDFNNDLFLNQFITKITLPGAKIDDAKLTFKFTPTNSLFSTDGTDIAPNKSPYIRTTDLFPNPAALTGTKLNFTINLFDHGFTSQTLIDAFSPNAINPVGGDNKISWRWQDDVIMEEATLTITVPEPATVLGLAAFGLIGSTMLRRKKNIA